MKAPPARFPDLALLGRGLNTVIGANGSNCGRVTIVHRGPVIYASTYPSEVVKCRIGARGELKLYCKYRGGVHCDRYGHHRGVPYETEVYRRVLQPLPFSVPKFYGSYEDDTWLILGYVERSLRLAKGPQPETIVRAAEWIGRFHAANEARVSLSTLSFVNRYNSEYYLGWMRRTSLFAASLHQRFPWLRTLSECFEESFDILLSAAPTVVHGEYYPHNILVSRRVIYPIDWESAAIAAGEIDLATLTEAWNPEIVCLCELAYRRARWPHSSPGDFQRRLAAARLYLCFRWLGEQPGWTLSENNQFYFEQMHSLGKQLGLI